MKRLIAAVMAAAGMVLLPAAAQATASTYQCFQVSAPYHSYPTPGGCQPGYAQVTLPTDTAQVLTVTNTKKTSTYARFNAFRLAGGTWTHTWGPWTARIGAQGFANPGQKIEGDALTPQGSYGFQFMFGVIAYNLARTPGAGSAIFLHVGDGQATAGCVSLPQADLLKIIRWLSPGSDPVITMGVLP